MTGRKGPSAGRWDVLKTLLDYTVETFYPEVRTVVGVRQPLKKLLYPVQRMAAIVASRAAAMLFFYFFFVW